MNARLVCATAAVLQCVCFNAAAQESSLPQPHNMPGNTATPTTDRADADIAAQRKDKAASLDTQAFVQKAAMDGMTEVQVAQIALKKSQDKKVRAFAQRMIKDHTAAGEKLKSVATKQGLAVPTRLDSEHQQIVEQMQALDGAAFDADYGRHMRMAHGEAVTLFESAASESSQVVQPLREFAADTLPTLKEHKELAAELAAVSQAAADR